MSEWQTTWTQNPRAERRGGSTPSRGTIHSGRYLSPGVGTADDLDLKSKGRKAWGSESPSGHHVGERPEKGRVQKKKSCEWSKFNAHDIVRIVRQCGKIGVPMAALHLDECDFSQLTASDWSQVLVLRPDLVGKFESIERDWSKDDEIDDVEEILQGSL